MACHGAVVETLGVVNYIGVTTRCCGPTVGGCEHERKLESTPTRNPLINPSLPTRPGRVAPGSGSRVTPVAARHVGESRSHTARTFTAVKEVQHVRPSTGHRLSPASSPNHLTTPLTPHSPEDPPPKPRPPRSRWLIPHRSRWLIPPWSRWLIRSRVGSRRSVRWTRGSPPRSRARTRRVTAAPKPARARPGPGA